MAKAIAVVKLAPGVIGYYDELSGLYLNMISPIGEVYDDMNYSKIKRAIMDRTLELVSGTLVPVSGFNPNDLFTKAPELIENEEPNTYLDVQESMEEPEEIEEQTEEDEASEEKVEEVTDIQEKDVKKKRTRKKKEEE